MWEERGSIPAAATAATTRGVPRRVASRRRRRHRLRVEGGFELDAEFTRYDPLVGGCEA
jgi:hypothetical protein